MMAILGMIFQNGVTGSTGPEMYLPPGAFENELGVQAPVGFWDPVGYTADGNTEKFKRRRSTEIKHGRVSMYACIGYIVPEYAKWPGTLSPSMGLKFADVPNGLAALTKVPGFGWAQMVLFCGMFEVSINGQDLEEPGNYGKGFLGMFGPVTDSAKRTRSLNAEIANGRLAMMAIIGMFFQDGLTGSAWGDWALYTDSPLRAFESELGVQAPVGFWDPVGFTRDGNEGNFKRRRATEVKHGRLSMLATMGYITPELTGKWPGYLSKSMDLKFADIPNGLGALSKVPQIGWAQIVAYCFAIEYSTGFSRDSTRFGYKPPLIDNGDPASNTRRLNIEIANGRLAMMAIIGMFFQDGLTGSAWGD